MVVEIALAHALPKPWGGDADAGSFKVSQGDAFFAQSDRVDIQAGAIGVVGLVAYTGGGGTIPYLLQRITRRHRSMPGGSNEIRVPTSPTQAKAAPNEWPPGTN